MIELMTGFLFILAAVSMIGAFIVLWVDYRQKEKEKEAAAKARLKKQKENADLLDACIEKNREEIARRMGE